MPHQKPLIDLAQLDRNRGEQLKAIDGLAARLQPGIARDGYSVSVQALVSLMTKFDSLTSPQRPYTWHGIAHWSGMTGLSPKQCSRAISVLQSLQLIEARVTWVAFGKRGMKIKINWSTVFEAGPITQDSEDLALWTARKTRQRTLFAPRRTPKQTPPVSVSETDTMSATATDTMSVSERDIVSVSSISNPQTYSPNHPQGGGVDEDFELTTETRRHGDEGQIQRGAMVRSFVGKGALCRSVRTPRQEISVDGPERTARETGANGSLRVVEIDKRAEVTNPSHQPPATSHKPSPMRITLPANFDTLVKFCVLLGISSARSICKQSLEVGYTPDQIAEILNWYESQLIVEQHLSETNGPSRTARYPYSAAQLACRLRDPDGIGVSPELGNWKGGQCGIWSSLAPKTTPNPRKQPRQSPQGTSPAIPVIRTTYTTAMAASEILTALEHHRAPGPVHQSFHRWAGDKTLPKTLAFWLKANGYAVEESHP
jgi:hypothetical protein